VVGIRKRENRSTRREFAATLAAAAVAPLAAPSGNAEAAPADPLAVEAEALTYVVLARHQKDLTADQVKEIKKSIYRGLAGADAMKQIKLKNSDEPDVVFSADVP
jgi:hypothetical protein